MHADTQVIERPRGRAKDPVKQAAAIQGAWVKQANSDGISVDEAGREYLTRAQLARAAVAERNEIQAAAQSEAIHEVIKQAPTAIKVLAELMNDKTVPAGVRRLCANDIATLACIQQTVQKRLESNTKDVSEMTAQELDAVIGNLQAARDSLDLPPDGEIVATDPA